MTRSLVVVMLVLAACAPPGSSSTTPSLSATNALLPGTCEYIGARFSLPSGFVAREQREPREPTARVTIEGEIGRHRILLDIIPRDIADYGGDTTPSGLTTRYFDAVRAAPFAAKWTDVREAHYQGAKATYPTLISVERFSPGPGIDGVYDNIILLLFPDDLKRGRYFYSFFWTDVHLAADPPASVAELEKLADGYTITGAPVGAPGRGCA